MQENCRICLADLDDSCCSVFKRVNGVAIEEMLQYVCNVKISRKDNFSKKICERCFEHTGISYNLKTKCQDTDRKLRFWERQRQQDNENEIVEYQEITEVMMMEEEDVKQEPTYIESVEDEEYLQSNEIKTEPSELVESLITYEEVKDPVEFSVVEYLEPEISSFAEEATPQSSRIKTIEFCTRCKPNPSFRTKIGLKIHNFTFHRIGNMNPLICHVCNFKFDENLKEESIARIIKKHQEAHEAGKTLCCSYCPEMFKSKRNWEEHQYRMHTSNKEFRCKACQGEFASSIDLNIHLEESSCRPGHEKPFRCYICNEVFHLGTAKKRHVLEKHQDKAGSDCPHCLRCKIPSAIAYDNHLKIHYEAPRFCCSFCGRSFYESDRLMTHIKRAHEGTRLICFFCSKEFKDKSGIARHILGVHFNQRNHRCHICTKSFTASYNLKEHIFSVHKQATKFYTCPTCNQDFLYRKQFERHRGNCNGYPEKRRR